MLLFNICIWQWWAGPKLAVQCIALPVGCSNRNIQSKLLLIIWTFCLAGNNFLNGTDSPIGQVSCFGGWHCKATAEAPASLQHAWLSLRLHRCISEGLLTLLCSQHIHACLHNCLQPQLWWLWLQAKHAWLPSWHFSLCSHKYSKVCARAVRTAA